MRGDCSFASSARAVAVEHRAAPPPCESHKVAFAPTAGEPAVRKRVPQLVRVEAIAEPSLPSSLADYLGDPAVRQATLSADPQPGKVGVGRALLNIDEFITRE